MKHKIDKLIPAQTVVAVDYVTCDLCGVDVDEVCQHPSDVNTVRIEMNEGVVHPESRDIQTTTYDMCTICFNERFIPWMHSQGAVAEIKRDNS